MQEAGDALGDHAVGLTANALPAPAEPAVTVAFMHPETYPDIDLNGGYGTNSEQATLKEIARFLERLGTRYLPPGQVLSIEVTNIDLAGQYQPWRKLAYDVRVMRDLYPPRIRLHYRLTQSGQILSDREELVVDVNYLANPSVRFVQAPLRYEKVMLESWFRARFAPR